MDHLPKSYQSAVRYQMRRAYKMREEDEARQALEQLLRELMELNPSAARSLEEGLDETLTLHRLQVPPTLRKTLSSTNVIESTFSMVGRLCDRVKNWQGGDHRERWMASGLLWAESRWKRVHGYRQIPALLQQLNLKPATSAVAESKMAA